MKVFCEMLNRVQHDELCHCGLDPQSEILNRVQDDKI